MCVQHTSGQVSSIPTDTCMLLKVHIAKSNFSNFRQKYFPDLIFFENGVFSQVFDIAKLSVNFV